MAARRFNGRRLVVASHNPGKVREIKALLEPFGAEVLSAASLNLPEPEETGATFAANAEIKALAAARAANIAALADDSGLVVDALDGAPGIYSARWAGPDKDFTLAMRRVHEALARMGAKAPHTARFICALTLAWPDGHFETVQGAVAGEIVRPPRGERGFGYDPIFRADGHPLTFGEMDPAEKHAISHRADAFAKLVAACFTDPDTTKE